MNYPHLITSAARCSIETLLKYVIMPFFSTHNYWKNVSSVSQTFLNTDRLSFLYQHNPTFTISQLIYYFFIFLKFYNYFIITLKMKYQSASLVSIKP